MISRLLRILGFALVQLAIVFVLIEIAARVLDPLGISYYPETARYLDTLIQEEPIGYRNQPGLKGKFFGAPVEISSLGMRDREVDEAKAPGEFRVMVLGDSVPFGIGVRQDQSLPAQLELALSRDAPPGRHYRTLNMGVPSYNTEQELIQLETLGPRLAPDAVILLFVANDIEKKKWVFEKRSSWYANLAQRSYAASLLVTGARMLLASRAASPAAGAPPGQPSAEDPRFLPGNERHDAIDRAFTGIAAWCRERGIPFAVFTQVGTEQAEALPLQAGRREGFPVLRLSPLTDLHLEGRQLRDFVNSVVDSHLNVEGNEIWSRALAAQIRQLGILGEDAPPRSSP